MSDTQHKEASHLQNHLDKLGEIQPEIDVFLAQVAEIQTSKKSYRKTPLQRIRREALKMSSRLEEFEKEYADSIALDFMSEDLHRPILDVVEARKMISVQYHACNEALRKLRDCIKGLSGKSSSLVSSVEEIEDTGKAVMRKILDLMLDTPDLGMTFDEWLQLSPADLKQMRPRGRPRTPVEVEIFKAKDELNDMVEACSKMTEGELNTLDKVIDGVEPAPQGRPMISPMAKMYRELTNLTKDLQELTSGDVEITRFHDVKKERLIKKIDDLRNKMTREEAKLSPIEAKKWELERLRSDHRDMVVAEQRLLGYEQAEMLLEIIRNEDRQIDVVDTIRSMDPEIKLSLTHRVNPAETRQRFERIRENGRLREDQLDEVSKLQDRMENFANYRSR